LRAALSSGTDKLPGGFRLRRENRNETSEFKKASMLRSV